LLILFFLSLICFSVSPEDGEGWMGVGENAGSNGAERGVVAAVNPARIATVCWRLRRRWLVGGHALTLYVKTRTTYPAQLFAILYNGSALLLFNLSFFCSYNNFSFGSRSSYPRSYRF
jgi:hypothetical protein